MKEIVEYTLAIIEAAWPVIIFVGLVIGLVLHWFLPKQLDIEPLTEYFEPPPRQEEKGEKYKHDEQFCQCSLSKELADYHGKDVPCPQCKKMTNHKSNALN